MFVPLPVSFFVVLFLFVLCCSLCFLLFFVPGNSSWLSFCAPPPWFLTLWKVKGEEEAQKRPKFNMGQNPTSLNMPASQSLLQHHNNIASLQYDTLLSIDPKLLFKKMGHLLNRVDVGGAEQKTKNSHVRISYEHRDGCKGKGNQWDCERALTMKGPKIGDEERKEQKQATCTN